MPIKFIIAIVLVVIVGVFTGFNLDNKTNFWFFYKFVDISVLYLVLGSFLSGVIMTLPFTFGKGKKGKTDKKSDSEKLPVTKEKKSFFKRKGSEDKTIKESAEDEVKSGTPTSTDEDNSE